MRWQIPLVVALALFVAVSCDQQPVEPAADQVADAPAFNFMNGPEISGIVWRFEGGQVQFWEFLETPNGEPWLLAFGIPDTDVLKDCGGAGTSEPQSILDVWQEHQPRDLILATRKNATVYAFDLEEFYATWDANEPNGFCEALQLDHLGEGTADQHWNDNDAFGDTDHNTWTEKANGKIYYDGAMYKIHFSGFWQWNGATETFTERIVAWVR
jgi:hypothetical protein